MTWLGGYLTYVWLFTFPIFYQQQPGSKSKALCRLESLWMYSRDRDDDEGWQNHPIRGLAEKDIAGYGRCQETFF